MRALEFLFEYDLNKINNLTKLIDQRKAEDNSLPEFDNIKELADLLQNKYHLSGEYIFWILHRYANIGIRRWEDIGSRVIPALQKYQKLKNKKKITGPNRDINQIKSLLQLEDLLGQFPDEELISNTDRNKEIENEFYKSKQATLIYNDADIKVVVPHTEAASCYFGKNTKWCTAAREDNMFQRYNSDGNLYIILMKKENQRYQFYFTDEQFMDERDEEINPNDLADQYPKLWDIFTPIAEKEDSVVLNKNPSEETQLMSVNREAASIKYINNPSEDVQLAAVNNVGLSLQFIKNPSEAVKLAAVSRNGIALRFIKNPSLEIQLAAVSQYGALIRFAENPSEKVQLAAVGNSRSAIKYIKNPSLRVQIKAVESDPYAIQYIKNPTEEVQLAAVKIDKYAIRYIKDPTEKVKRLADDY